jgi:CheY-like chemotaxis protein
VRTTRDVMIVEDDDDIRAMMALVLEVGGFEVIEASNGVEALRLLREGPLPALVLLDLMMPGLNGADVLTRIRHDPRLAHLAVVVVSGDSNAHRLARNHGADACLFKPVDAAKLLEVARHPPLSAQHYQG